MPSGRRLMARRAASRKSKTPRAPNCAPSKLASLCARMTGVFVLEKRPTWREIKGAYGRRRRALRQAMLEPLLVGWPVLRDVVMNALAARGHLVLCELGDVRFFVDPSDRVVGAWLL